jgi:hypothetical protein
VLRGDRSAAAFLAMLASNRPERFEGYLAWEPTEFEVTSTRAIDVGLDDEALQMEPPSRFSVRPAAVRVRRPTHAIGYSPAARHQSAQAVLRMLWHTAWGRTTRAPAATATRHPARERR